MSVRTGLVFAATGTALLLLSSFGGPGKADPENGSIEGKVLGYGGSPREVGSPPLRLAGTVRAYRATEQIAVERVAEGAAFRFRVQPGTYLLRIDGNVGCVRTVVVRAGVMSRADLVCDLK